MKYLNSQIIMTVSAVSVFINNPLMEYAICPLGRYLFPNMNEENCDRMIAATSIVQVAITSYYAVNCINQIGVLKTNQAYANHNQIMSFSAEYLFNAYQFVFPAGLGAYNAQSLIYNAAPSTLLFIIGCSKSAFEMTTVNAVARVVFDRDINERSLLSYKHSAISGGIAAINVAQAANIYFYGIKAVMEGRSLDIKLMLDADDYSIGYAIARPFYQVGMVANDVNQLNMPMVGSFLYFSAPVCRGYILGLSQKGSINVPGKNISLVSNVIDGIAIASVSMFNTYLDQSLKVSNGQLAAERAGTIANVLKPVIEKISFIKSFLDTFGTGPMVGSMLIAIEVSHQSYDAYQDFIRISVNDTYSDL
jgi:hypothetical protein